MFFNEVITSLFPSIISLYLPLTCFINTCAPSTWVLIISGLSFKSLISLDVNPLSFNLSAPCLVVFTVLFIFSKSRCSFNFWYYAGFTLPPPDPGNFSTCMNKFSFNTGPFITLKATPSGNATCVRGQ